MRLVRSRTSAPALAERDMGRAVAHRALCSRASYEPCVGAARISRNLGNSQARGGPNVLIGTPNDDTRGVELLGIFQISRDPRPPLEIPHVKHMKVATIQGTDFQV